MGKARYSLRLAKEFGLFIVKRKVFWLIPILLVLLPLVLFVVGGEAITPLIYTIF